MRFRVDATGVGRRLDQVVADLPEVESRADAQRLIDAGRVTVDGAARPKRHVLSLGEAVEVLTAPDAGPGALVAEDIPLAILHEDEHLLVVDKPAGMATHPSRGHERGTLVNALLGHAIGGGEDPTRPGIVHRLDLDTSGLIVVARTPRAHRRLQRLIREREVERRYLALVHGAPPPALTVDRPVARDPRRPLRMAVTHVGGRDAVTHLRVVERLGGLTLLDARLETGRTHQIRVHLESAGHPVVGDRVYGAGRPDPVGVGRQFLHAWRLAFPHPETDEEIAVESELPPDLAGALDRARAAAARDR